MYLFMLAPSCKPESLFFSAMDTFFSPKVHGTLPDEYMITQTILGDEQEPRGSGLCCCFALQIQTLPSTAVVTWFAVLLLPPLLRVPSDVIHDIIKQWCRLISFNPLSIPVIAVTSDLTGLSSEQLLLGRLLISSLTASSNLFHTYTNIDKWTCFKAPCH